MTAPLEIGGQIFGRLTALEPVHVNGVRLWLCKCEQVILLQVTGDRVSMLDEYRVGDEVRVEFNLRGRETNRNGESKFWNSLEAWRMERIGERRPSTNRGGAHDSPPPSGDDSDIPFLSCELAHEPSPIARVLR